MSNPAKATWLSYVGFGLVSLGVMALVLGSFGNLTKAFSMQTDVARADELWDQGEHVQAANMYKQALNLEDNPMVGNKIPEVKRVQLYARIIRSDLLADNHPSALKHAQRVLDLELLTFVSVATEDSNTRQFLFNVREGVKLVNLAEELGQLAKTPPKQRNEAKAKSRYEMERQLRLQEFAQIRFDKNLCPLQTARINKQLTKIVRNVRDPEIVQALRKRM